MAHGLGYGRGNRTRQRVRAPLVIGFLIGVFQRGCAPGGCREGLGVSGRGVDAPTGRPALDERSALAVGQRFNMFTARWRDELRKVPDPGEAAPGPASVGQTIRASSPAPGRAAAGLHAANPTGRTDRRTARTAAAGRKERPGSCTRANTPSAGSQHDDKIRPARAASRRSLGPRESYDDERGEVLNQQDRTWHDAGQHGVHNEGRARSRSDRALLDMATLPPASGSNVGAMARPALPLGQRRRAIRPSGGLPPGAACGGLGGGEVEELRQSCTPFAFSRPVE